MQYIVVKQVVTYHNRKKKKKKIKELSSENTSQFAEEVKEEKVYKKVKTPAQLAFDKAQEKRVSYNDSTSLYCFYIYFYYSKLNN